MERQGSRDRGDESLTTMNTIDVDLVDDAPQVEAETFLSLLLAANRQGVHVWLHSALDARVAASRRECRCGDGVADVLVLDHGISLEEPDQIVERRPEG